MKTISIATDYSTTPLGRYPTDGNFSGARFREDFLKPSLSTENKIKVTIDGTEGYGSSFLEEAFGGLVRKKYFTKDQLRDRLEIISTDPEFAIYKQSIWKYIDEAKPEA